jgi:hypothetical protein
MVKTVPVGWGSLGVIVAIRVLLAKFTFPGVKVMLQLWRAPESFRFYLVKVG